VDPEGGQRTSIAVGPLAAHLDEPLLVVDVGCRDGEAVTWKPFEPHVRIVGFEPDPEECERLGQDYDGPADRTFIPLALGARTGEAVLHVTRSPQSSSLYEPDPEAIARHPDLEVHEVVGRRPVALSTLDTWAATAGDPRVDFLKVDVQGAELDVLRGAERTLAGVRALQLEVEFQPLYREQPLFAEVDECLRKLGFVLWRLRELRHLSIEGVDGADLGSGVSRLPDAVELDPSGGRLSWGDAFYVRPDLGAAGADGVWTAPLRDACVAAALGLPELTQRGLARAAAGAPANTRAEIEVALSHVRTGGFGRPEQATELEYLRTELRTQEGAAAERLVRLQELEGQRARALAEIDMLRERLARYERGGELPGTLHRLLRKREALARRARWWGSPRLGVLQQHPPAPVRVPRWMPSLRPPGDAPAISIVTPTLNQARFIERTIRSVLSQGYPALEYVVQDGASDDGTSAVLDAYRDRLSACVSEPDSGQADALNRGFARTSGEIMAWINSDDGLLPGALAAVARHFARNPETDLVYGHRLLIDTDDRLVGSWIMPRHEDWTLDCADLIPQETVFWRRRIWEATGARLDVRYRYALDWELLLRFREAGARMVRLPLPLGACRINNGEKTKTELEAIGREEMGRLRNGRAAGLPAEEAWEQLRPYLRRHVIHHTLHRLAMRVPALWTEVDLGSGLRPRDGRR
jgi:FkbM family methyltransferase